MEECDITEAGRTDWGSCQIYITSVEPSESVKCQLLAYIHTYSDP